MSLKELNKTAPPENLQAPPHAGESPVLKSPLQSVASTPPRRPPPPHGYLKACRLMHLRFPDANPSLTEVLLSAPGKP
jgi:hypothetical protein